MNQSIGITAEARRIISESHGMEAAHSKLRFRLPPPCPRLSSDGGGVTRAVTKPSRWLALIFVVLAVASVAITRDAVAVNGATKCSAAKWTARDTASEKLCEIRVKNAATNVVSPNCKLEGDINACRDVFGPYFDFPTKTEENKNDAFVWNCAADGSRTEPAGINTYGATECACPVGTSEVNGKCTCPVGKVEVDGECLPICPDGQGYVNGVCADTCPAGKSRLKAPDSPCVEDWRVKVLDWCNEVYPDVANRVRVPNTSLTPGLSSTAGEGGSYKEYTFVNESPQESSDQSGKYSCYIGKSLINQYYVELNGEDTILDEAFEDRCTSWGYVVYHDDGKEETLPYIGSDGLTEIHYYCMPQQKDYGDADTTFNREYDSCSRSDTLEIIEGKRVNWRWQEDAHACVSKASAPLGVGARVLARGTVAVFWRQPQSGYPDEYVVRIGTPDKSNSLKRITNWKGVATVLATVAGGGQLPSLTVTVGDAEIGGASKVRFQVEAVSRLPYSPQASDPPTAETPDVEPYTFDVICKEAGWAVSRVGLHIKCHIPIVNAATGDELDFCLDAYKPYDSQAMFPENQRRDCFDIFGDNRRQRSKLAFPPYEPNARYVYNCPIGAPSADRKTCKCPNLEDYTQEEDGYLCYANLDCSLQNREQTNDFTCGGCVEGAEEVDDECRIVRDCPAENRETISRYECGVCVAGHRQYTRFERADAESAPRQIRVCRPILRIPPDDLGGYCRGAMDAAGGEFELVTAATVRAGRLCEFPPASGKAACYSPDYGSAGSDETTLYKLTLAAATLGLVVGGQIPAETELCDNAYPVCPGTGFVRRNNNLLDACVCPAEHVETADGQACRFDCENVHYREDAEGLASCGACLPGHVEDELGGAACLPQLNCADEHRMQINAHTCGPCLANQAPDKNGACLADMTCPQGRIQRTPYSCGGCAAGYAASETMVTVVAEGDRVKEWRTCLRTPCPSGFRDENGNCPETPQAAQCAAAAEGGASVRRWGAKLDDGGCLPVQTCLFGSAETLLRQAADAAAGAQVFGCHLWSDTDRPEAGFRAVTVIAGLTVKASVSYLRAAGECSGERIGNEFVVDTFANPTFYAPSCNAGLFDCPKGLKDPNNPFSLCNPDPDNPKYDQANCEGLGVNGEWEQITSDPAQDSRSRDSARVCKIGEDVCYVNANKGDDFNPDATAFYLYPEAANRGNDIPADGFLFADKVAGECRTQYPATCARGVLRVAGNPFSGCVFTEVRSPGVPRVSATASALATVGAASLSWAPSAVIGAATLWGYAVWREVDGAPFVSIGFTTGTVYADAAATPESEVRYRIRARVPEGELLDSDPSDVVRIPGCRRTGHAAVERPGSLPPLCVPESAKSAAQKCADAGWDVIYSYDSPVARCGVSVRDAPSGHVENCGLWGDFHLACEDAFGAGDDLNFPTNHGYRREFVFNCGMGGTGRVPDPEYDLYADYGPRQECVCQAGSFESPTTGQCASCSVLHRLPLPGVTGRCGECAQEMREDGTCYVEWTMRTTPIPPNRGAVAVSGLNGTLLAAPSASHGTFVTIAARPAARHYLSGWAGDPRCAAVGNPENPGAEKLCIVRMTANVDLTAYFTAQLLQTVTYAQIPAGQIEGTLTASVPSGGTTLRGATVTFTAAPAADRYVSGWAGDQRCADIGDLQNTGAEKTCAVRVTANVNLTAYFNAAWTIAFSGADVSARRTIADGGATVVSGDRAPGGATIVFSVTPTLGYVARWTNRGAAVCNGQNPCLLTADAHLDVTAAYAPQPQTVVYSATPDGQVGGTLTASVPSGGTTLRGFAVTFIASPAAGWRVGRWDGDAENCALSSLPCALTANADLSVRVHFYDDERSANNAALIAEVAKPPGAANPATVVALLNLPGGDPNAKDAADRPLLIVAARNGHARIVSILVTAGADPTATDPSFYNWNVPQHAAAYLPAAAAGPRALRASVLYHFGDALDVVGGGGSAGFDWNRQDGGRALDLLAQAEDRRPAPAGENAGIIYQMADYIRARGGECDSAAEKTRRRICIAACPFGQNFVDGFCFCPGGQGPNPENGACGFCPPGEWTRMDGGCGACPAGQEENGGFCACPAGQAVLSRDNPVCYPQAIADAYAKCAGSGHIPSVAGSPANPSFTCAVYNRHADFNAASSGSAANQNACAFPDSVRQSDPDARLCSEVFGPQFAFPQKPPTGQERYVFNCGASQARRLPSVPAAINTVGATECACPAGEELVEGICVPHAVADVADDCAAHGWDVSVDPADNTLLCAPFFRLYNDAAGAPDDEDYEDGCAIEASAATPSCAEVFGDPPQFPTAAGADDRTYFVANCSRGGSIPGAIPASVNTVAAAACSCNSGDGYVGNWPACACPAEQGTLADGNCGACPDGQGILPDKSCGLCPAERGILANAACGSCSAGEKIRADGTCGACPTGQTGASDFYCGVCTGGQEVINGACACPAGESPVDFTDGETLCYPQAVADAADKCRQSGHIPSYGLPSEVSLHACAVSTRNADSQDGDKAACLLSDDAADSPRCSEVFGADLVFPQRPAVSTTLAYVYNCDPNGATGMIPATVNTIGAVQCVCPAEQGLVDGSCRACPSEQGILANGSCGACPFGQGSACRWNLRRLRRRNRPHQRRLRLPGLHRTGAHQRRLRLPVRTGSACRWNLRRLRRRNRPHQRRLRLPGFHRTGAHQRCLRLPVRTGSACRRNLRRLPPRPSHRRRWGLRPRLPDRPGN